jgi:hypothetical protein
MIAPMPIALIANAHRIAVTSDAADAEALAAELATRRPLHLDIEIDGHRYALQQVA